MNEDDEDEGRLIEFRHNPKIMRGFHGNEADLCLALKMKNEKTNKHSHKRVDIMTD